MSYLEVICGELQHVPQDVADDLGLPLYEHILIVQRLDDLRLHLEEHMTKSVIVGLLYNKADVILRISCTNNKRVTAWVVTGANLGCSFCLDNNLPLSFHRVAG